MKESFGFIERADKVSEVRFLKVTIQFSINTVELRCTDTSLLRTVFFVPGESPYIFCKLNLLNMDTHLCGQRTIVSCPRNRFSYM